MTMFYYNHPVAAEYFYELTLREKHMQRYRSEAKFQVILKAINEMNCLQPPKQVLVMK